MRHLNDNIVQSKIDEYSNGRSKRTTGDLLTKIKTALKYAHARGYIPYDFTNILKASGNETENRNKVLSLHHYHELKNYLLEHIDKRENIFIYTVLGTGLRRGECLGLRPENIYESYIDVKHSISPTSSDSKLKSKSAYRKIPITKEMYDMLTSISVTEYGYLFNMKNFNQSQYLKRILKEINVPATTLHGLRATYASIAYSLTKDDVYVSDLLGHIDPKTTKEFYIKTLEETSDSNHAKVTNFFNS